MNEPANEPANELVNELLYRATWVAVLCYAPFISSWSEYLFLYFALAILLITEVLGKVVTDELHEKELKSKKELELIHKEMVFFAITQWGEDNAFEKIKERAAIEFTKKEEAEYISAYREYKECRDKLIFLSVKDAKVTGITKN